MTLSAADVVLQNNVTVTGTITRNGSVLSSPVPAGAVTFPPLPPTGITVPVGGTRNLAPGAYGPVTVFANATLRLSSGTYFMQSLDIEPGARILLDSGSQEVRVNVRTTFTFRGSVASEGGPGPLSRLAVVVQGSTAVAVEGLFQGALYAPNATMNLGTSTARTQRGEFFARTIEVRPDVSVVHTPFRCQQ